MLPVPVRTVYWGTSQKATTEPDGSCRYIETIIPLSSTEKQFEDSEAKPLNLTKRVQSFIGQPDVDQFVAKQAIRTVLVCHPSEIYDQPYT